MKKTISSLLLAILLTLPVSAAANKFATVYHPDTGDRKVVMVGDPNAFKGGYTLETKLGAIVPSVVAGFQTSLASKLTAAETSSMTLVSGTTEDGTTLNGTYGFTLDEGTSNKEYVVATCVNTACSSLIRGISFVTGSTSVSALKKEHRRGASVKITDHPLLAIITSILNGRDSLPSSLYYSSHPSGLSASTTIMDKNYIDTVGAGGFTSLNASTTRGLEVYGTSPETVGINASSTSGLSLNGDGSLQITASTTGGIKTDSNGLYIDESKSFNWTGENSFSATTTLGQTILTATGTDYMSVPSKGYVDTLISVASTSIVGAIVSDTLKGSLNTERSKSDDTNLTKVKEFTVKADGTYRLSLEGRWSGAGGNSGTYAIYRNGSATGSSGTIASSTYVTYTNDVSFRAGDLAQLYYASGTGTSVVVRNFRIYFDLGYLSTAYLTPDLTTD